MIAIGFIGFSTFFLDALGAGPGRRGTNLGVEFYQLMSERSTAFLEQYSELAPVVHPHVYGRDGSNPYYDLLYHVSLNEKPNLTVELGCCTGGSTSYLAAGSSGKVISIDIAIQEGARSRLAVFPNVELIEADTREPGTAELIASRGPIDILFIDTDHTAEQVTIEMSLFAPLVKEGGIILLDDVRMNSMPQWWDELDEDKLEMPHLHWTSFGVIFR